MTTSELEKHGKIHILVRLKNNFILNMDFSEAACTLSKKLHVDLSETACELFSRCMNISQNMNVVFSEAAYEFFKGCMWGFHKLFLDFFWKKELITDSYLHVFHL